MTLTQEQQAIIARIAEEKAQQYEADRTDGVLYELPLSVYIKDAIRQALDELEVTK